MKRKLLAGLCVGMLTLSLVGCSSSEDKKEDEGNKAPVEETAGFTGEKTAETKYDPEKPEMVVTTVKFEDGKPVDVNIDIREENGSMKSELSEKGEYVMKEGEEHAWHEQIDLLEKFIVENNFDLEKVTLSDDQGHTDAVSGVTIKVPSYVDGVKEVLDQVK